ncbi:phosphoinositide phosphatase SAC7-like isoform X2 [Wolffia australiana]
MRLWELPEHYIIEPTDGTLESCLAISRADGSMNMIDEVPVPSSGTSPRVQSIFGVIGILKLLVGGCLLVITERECVGSYLGHPIFKVSSLRVLPCHNASNISKEQRKVDLEFSSLLNVAEKTTGLYFSYDINLTLSIQRMQTLNEGSKLLPLWRQADPHYMWNNYLMESLIESKLEPFLLPIVQGSYQSFQTEVGNNKIDVTLIARRCTRRTGTRMWRRGADSDGYVANFVETEQILQLNGFTASFVQVRGSIPFLWEQIVDLTYKPRFEVVRPEEAPKVAERHFMDLSKRYGSIIAVDLINKHGGEGRLNEMYASSMEKINIEDTQYLHFDFHSVCGHTRFERLSLLYEQIEGYLEKQGYFLSDPSGAKLDTQMGIVRSNCIDCLDRTNVTQSLIGRKMLERQLRRLGIFSDVDTINLHPDFDARFKMSWANHGDEISMQYSGTPALKGDFVRYGKRTFQGIFNDGRNALARYYFNNFVDGSKQDAIDLLHGNYIAAVNRDMTFTSQNRALESLTSFPLASALALAGVIFASISLRKASNDITHLFFSMAWAGVSLGIMALVRAHGRLFTNRPRLRPSHV